MSRFFFLVWSTKMYLTGGLIVLFLSTNSVLCEGTCDHYVDITDGVKDGTSIIKDGLRYSGNNYFTLDKSIKGCICNVKLCVRKCCSDGEIMDMTLKKCVSSTAQAGVFGDFSEYSIINVPENKICEENYTKVIIDRDYKVVNSVLVGEGLTIAMNDFCLANYSAIACIKSETPVDSIIIGLGMIISMPFLLATFIVYLLLPERNLHRRALMSYVFTLLAAYITLVTIQLNSAQYTTVLCHILGYSVIFFFLVSFFWMNVMCVDMWLAFSGMKTVLSKKTAERKRFIIYCVYAWGVPILHVILVFLLNTYLDPKSKFHPEIGVSKCFLGGEMRIFYYFYMPMTVLIGINIVLFILTTIRIQKVRKETSMLKQSDSRRHTYDDDKQQFNLYLKLMFAMGMNWIMEIVSWAVGYMVKDVPPFVWYLTDFTNAMYGVVIFLLFVFKKKIWRSLKKRYYVCIGKPHLAHSMTTSSARTTRTSNYSTTETGVSNDIRLTEMKNGRTPEESALNRQ